MKTEQEIQEVARIRYGKHYTNYMSKRLSFKDGAKWMKEHYEKEHLDLQCEVKALRLLVEEREGDNWIPISEYDKQLLNPIMRWHKLWKCPICVWYNHNEESNLVWVEKTLTTQWPEESFLPFYQLLPIPPKEREDK